MSPADGNPKVDFDKLAVIVTGAAGAMGRAMTLGLAAAGVRVAAAELPSRRAEADQLLEAARHAGLQDKIEAIDCDVSRWPDCTNAVKAAIDRFGALHGLVNNAGVGMQGFGNVMVGKRKPFYEHDAEQWRGAIDVNFNGPFMMAKAIAPVLVAQGWGRIVNVVTSHFTMVAEGFSPYGPTNAALEAATVIWSKDLAHTGVTVNALLPGGAGNSRMIPLSEVPDRSKLVQPDVMVAPIVWLMSARSDGVTGRRFIGKEWDPALDGTAAAQKAGAPAGWPT